MIRILLLFFAMTSTAGAMELSLKDAIEIALENNRDIKIQKENVVVSEGEVTFQKGAFDPILNISSFYNDGETPTVNTFIPDGTVNQQQFGISGNVEGRFSTGTFYDVFNVSSTRTETDSPLDDLSPSWFNDVTFSIGQNLLRDFGADVNNAFVVTASRSSQISMKEFENVVTNVLLEVETRYWLLVAATQNLELERNALELAVDLQNRNQIQVDVGVLPPVAVTQAKSEVAARELDVIRAENTLQAAEDDLKNVLAMDLSLHINATDEPTTEVFVFNEQESLEEAYEQRPEIEQAELNIENKQTLKKYYSNQRLPTLSIEGSVNLQGLGGDENPDRLSFEGEPEPIPSRFLGSSEAFSQIFGADFTTWQILGVFSFPIFNRAARGQYVKASAEYDRSVITLKKTQDDVALDVKSAIREIENSLRAIDAARVSVELAKEVVINEQERLNVGLGTTREVLEAQRDLIDAGVRKITAIANYNIALAELERAKGTLLEKDGVIIEE